MNTKLLFIKTGLLVTIMLFIGKVHAQDASQQQKTYQYRQTGSKYVISVENGNELSASITDFVKEQGIRAGSVTGLGSASEATLRFYHPATKEYTDKTFNEQMQIANLTGNISTMDGNPYLNLSITLGREDFTSIAGNLLAATVSGFTELVIEDFGKTTVERSLDPLTGLTLYDFDKPSPGIPIRAYPDAFWTTEKKEEVFNSNDDWTIYYAGQEWVDFLVYQMVLVNKGYTYKDGTPDYVTAYLERMSVGEIPQSPVTLTLSKPGWMTQEIMFYPEAETSPGGMKYTVKSKLYPGQDLLSGKKGPGVPASIYEPYGKHRDWLKAKDKDKK